MVAAGARFEGYVRTAMQEAQELTLAELARQSGIKETNWHSWFRGEHRPRRNTLALAERVLNRTPDQLLAAWDGGRLSRPQKAAPAPDLTAAITAQTVAIERLVERLERLLPSESFDADQAWAAVSQVLRQRPADEKGEVVQALDAEQERLASRSARRRSGRRGSGGG